MQKNVDTVAPLKRIFKKAAAEIIKMKTGDKVQGKYLGSTTSPWLDLETGEEKKLTRLFFKKDSGEKFILFQDGGLRNAMANAMVIEGDWVEIEKLDQTTLEDGRTVNQYDIYTAQ